MRCRSEKTLTTHGRIWQQVEACRRLVSHLREELREKPIHQHPRIPYQYPFPLCWEDFRAGGCHIGLYIYQDWDPAGYVRLSVEDDTLWKLMDAEAMFGVDDKFSTMHALSLRSRTFSVSFLRFSCSRFGGVLRHFYEPITPEWVSVTNWLYWNLPGIHPFIDPVRNHEPPKPHPDDEPDGELDRPLKDVLNLDIMKENVDATEEGQLSGLARITVISDWCLYGSSFFGMMSDIKVVDWIKSVFYDQEWHDVDLEYASHGIHSLRLLAQANIVASHDRLVQQGLRIRAPSSPSASGPHNANARYWAVINSLPELEDSNALSIWAAAAALHWFLRSLGLVVCGPIGVWRFDYERRAQNVVHDMSHSLLRVGLKLNGLPGEQLSGLTFVASIHFLTRAQETQAAQEDTAINTHLPFLHQRSRKGVKGDE
ncbi:hypothetical protein GGR52DRAFT_574744 [Hypoxylon sp. FL1284]|nr:hypothetical protein GGR52DRAFT_574744 [Hypoxylon sp. FL1284]